MQNFLQIGLQTQATVTLCVTRCQLNSHPPFSVRNRPPPQVKTKGDNAPFSNKPALLPAPIAVAHLYLRFAHPVSRQPYMLYILRYHSPPL